MESGDTRAREVVYQFSASGAFRDFSVDDPLAKFVRVSPALPPKAVLNVRNGLLRELAEIGELLVATHVPFPSVGHVAVSGDTFRWVTTFWDF